jgi:molecular chaperone HscA
MELLNIAEPGMGTAPHQHRLAVGIDLGTTNSLVAAVRNGSGSILNDDQGRALLPSAVRYHGDGRIDVGHEALARAQEDPANTFVSVKRFMGRGLNDVAESTHLPYRFVDEPGMLRLDTATGIKSPVEISAEVLKVMRQRAEQTLGGELAGAVITVPAYFDDAQRQATRDAARLAGLHVLRLLNEPTAAAVAYGLDHGSEGVYAVYDLGGGTFDISILRMQRGVFEVLATNGDSALGGDDFDRLLYTWLLEQAGMETPDIREAGELWSIARRAKEALSEQHQVQVALPRSEDAPPILLTREQFTGLTRELLKKTFAPVRRALRDAALNADEIKGVVLVGGATRMPHLREAVAEFFGQAPLTDHDPDQVVALGAAIQADVLAGNRSADDWLLLDVIPLSLGIETMGGLVEKLIPRNATLPVARAQEFTTFKDGQTAMSLHVVQGERELVADCRSLARFELRGIPPMAAGAARIQVTFQVDADGLLSVTAREQTSGVEAAVTVKPSYGLSDEEVARMLTESHACAGDDAQSRAWREQQVDAQRLCDATRSAVAEDGEALLSDAERRAIDDALQTLEAALAGTDIQTLKQAQERLNQLTTEFAARRMDNSIQTALSGRSVAEL